MPVACCLVLPVFCCLLPVACCLVGHTQSGQGGGQGGDSGVGQSQAQLLRADLPTAQRQCGLSRDGIGGQAVLSGAEALIERFPGGKMPGRELRVRRQAEQLGCGGADRVESGLGKAPLAQQGEGTGHGGAELGDLVGLIQHEARLQAGVGRQLVQQSELGRGLRAFRVQDAEAEVLRQPGLGKRRHGVQQGPASCAGDADGQFGQGLRGGGYVEHRDNLLIGKYLSFLLFLSLS